MVVDPAQTTAVYRVLGRLTLSGRESPPRTSTSVVKGWYPSLRTSMLMAPVGHLHEETFVAVRPTPAFTVDKDVGAGRLYLDHQRRAVRITRPGGRAWPRLGRRRRHASALPAVRPARGAGSAALPRRKAIQHPHDLAGGMSG